MDDPGLQVPARQLHDPRKVRSQKGLPPADIEKIHRAHPFKGPIHLIYRQIVVGALRVSHVHVPDSAGFTSRLAGGRHRVSQGHRLKVRAAEPAIHFIRKKERGQPGKKIYFVHEAYNPLSGVIRTSFNKFYGIYKLYAMYFVQRNFVFSQRFYTRGTEAAWRSMKKHEEQWRRSMEDFIKIRFLKLPH
jgi:hypothetical protein